MLHVRAARAATALIPFLLASSLVASFAAPARAEETAQLSLADALATAGDKAPDIVLARHSTREASALRVGAGLVMPANPRVQVDGRPPITGGTLADLGYSATIEAPFDLGGAPGARVREADRHVDLANAELAVARLRAKAMAFTAYVRAQVAGERIRATASSVEIARRIVAASKDRAELGAAGDIEQSLASSDAAQLEAQIVAATHERDLYLMDLREALDLPPDRGLVLTTPLTDPSPPLPADALVARALALRPELDVIEKRIALLDATDERLGKETFPRVGLYGGVDAAPVSPIFGFVGVSVELPFVQRNQGPRAVVRAARDAESSRLELLRSRIRRDVTSTRAALDARRAELDTLTERALPTAERTLTLVETGWRSGRFDIFRVTTAARDVARVRSLRLDALEAAWLDRIALDRATGGLR